MFKKKASDDAAEFVHNVYSHLLSLLELSPDHHRDLNRRGLDDNDIKSGSYKSLPLRRRELADKCAKKFGGSLLGVPGFWQNDKGEWELAGKSGIVIPVRTPDGRISGLKIRVDKPSSPSSKYLLLSSNPNAKDGEGGAKYPNGTSAKIQIHYPYKCPAKIKTLRITEGELKADIANSLLPEYTVSIPGVSMWRMAVALARQVNPQTILLAFDSDKDKVANSDGSADTSYVGGKPGEAKTNPATKPEDYVVGKALANLYLALKGAGYETKIEDWPPEAGKGIDDVLINGATDQIKIIESAEADQFANDLLMSDIPQGWVYVVGVKRFFNIQTLVELDKEQFTDKFCHEESGNPAIRALKSPAFPKVDFPTYLPNQDAIVQIGDRRYFNSWRPNRLRPEHGSVKVFLDHCEYMFPNKEERDILLDWLAFNVQSPGEKILWAILMQGVQGTGKSYFGFLMRLMLGAQNVSSPTNDLLHEVYTGWQKSCQLVVIEEVMARGRLELMNKLKPMITQETTMVREMHKPAYEQPNVFNILMLTNHEDAIIIDKTDRRYCVLFSPAEPREGAYYEKLWKWTQDNPGRILNWMQERDLSHFRPKGHAPMTTGKREVITLSETPLQGWLREKLEEEQWPFAGDIISPAHLMECLPRGLTNYASPQSLSRQLKALGCRPLGTIKLKAGNRARLWSARRHEVWASAEPDTIAAEYEKWSATSQPGGNPMLEAKPM